MPKTTSTTTAEHQIEEGRGLRALRTALIEGEQSGPGEPFNFDAFIRRKRQARKAPK
jgi:Arc/MetJ-type ribon-helix-helix transcriptional regulator